jgi:hypothetical protein
VLQRVVHQRVVGVDEVVQHAHRNPVAAPAAEQHGVPLAVAGRPDAVVAPLHASVRDDLHAPLKISDSARRGVR